jgi:hypothetical protein
MIPPREPPYKDAARYWMRQAIARAGTGKLLGKALGLTQQTISLAKRHGRVSGELAVLIHHWSEGEIGAHKLRPDLWTGPQHVPPPPARVIIVHPKVVRGSA